MPRKISLRTFFVLEAFHTKNFIMGCGISCYFQPEAVSLAMDLIETLRISVKQSQTPKKP
jgi:hypothetical protein